MPLYTVEQTDPLSSDFTKNLSEDDFTAYREIAEAVLGLRAPALTDALDIARLRIAILLQINFMSQFGLDPYVKASEGMSSQASSSVVWRDRFIDPRAWAIVQRVVGTTVGWFGAGLGSQSHRTNDTGRGSWPAVPPNFERFR